jgi:hypothetical protein
MNLLEISTLLDEEIEINEVGEQLPNQQMNMQDPAVVQILSNNPALKAQWDNINKAQVNAMQQNQKIAATTQQQSNMTNIQYQNFMAQIKRELEKAKLAAPVQQQTDQTQQQQQTQQTTQQPVQQKV